MYWISNSCFAFFTLRIIGSFKPILRGRLSLFGKQGHWSDSCTATAQLIYIFVFALAKCRFPQDVAHITVGWYMVKSGAELFASFSNMLYNKTVVDYWGIGYDVISTREYQNWHRLRLGQYWYSLVDITSFPMAYCLIFNGCKKW